MKCQIGIGSLVWFGHLGYIDPCMGEGFPSRIDGPEEKHRLLAMENCESDTVHFLVMYTPVLALTIDQLESGVNY